MHQSGALGTLPLLSLLEVELLAVNSQVATVLLQGTGSQQRPPPTFFKGTGSCERSHAASIVAGGLATGIYTTNSTDAVRSVLRWNY
jgi:hypothetical protein